MAMAIPNLIGGLTQICAAIVNSRIHQGREETDSEKIQELFNKKIQLCKKSKKQFIMLLRRWSCFNRSSYFCFDR